MDRVKEIFIFSPNFIIKAICPVDKSLHKNSFIRVQEYFLMRIIFLQEKRDLKPKPIFFNGIFIYFFIGSTTSVLRKNLTTCHTESFIFMGGHKVVKNQGVRSTRVARAWIVKP